MIYEGSPAKHLRGLAATIIRKLDENHRCIYLNSLAMVAGMRSYLLAAGLDLNHFLAKGALVLSSEEGHLIDGLFDVDRMLAKLAHAVDQALRDGYSGLWATGDMTWEFGHERNFVKLLEYERALEQLFQEQPCLSGVCQYHVDTLPVGVVQQGLHTHQGVYVNEVLSRINPYYLAHESLASRPKASLGRLKQMIERVHSA
jgi:hypothetical protein